MAPSADSEIVTQLPYGLFFNVLGSDSESLYDESIKWLYVSADYNGLSYTGYVSEEFTDWHMTG